MIRQALFAALVSGALALGAGQGSFGGAHAQSVTYAPAPSENLVRLQERVGELEQMLRQATGESERLGVELRRVQSKNALLERQLADALGQGGTPAVAPGAPAAASGAGQLGTLPAAQAPVDSAQLLQDATRYLQLGRYAESEAAFAAFAQANPQSPDAPEARYFVGRTQVAQRRFPDAADTFVAFLKDYPAAARAPDAWTMLGVSLKGMDKADQACAVFRDLPVKYPRASPAVRNLAVAEARAANCPAR